MTTTATATASPTHTPSALRQQAPWNRTLWGAQIVLALFFASAAAPKLLSEKHTVEMFGQIGAGQWFRYLVGILELSGAIGLVIPRLSGLAATGLAGVMVGATITQVVILDSAIGAVVPVVLIVVFALVARGRAPQTKALVAQLAH
jgi:putative oxidoreductase